VAALAERPQVGLGIRSTLRARLDVIDVRRFAGRPAAALAEPVIASHDPRASLAPLPVVATAAGAGPLRVALTLSRRPVLGAVTGGDQRAAAWLSAGP